MHTIHLKKGREASALRRHPWIFSGAIDRVRGEPGSGETVRVLSDEGQLLGIGAYSPHSQIRVRFYSFEDERIDEEFFAAALARAVGRRAPLLARPDRDACRLVYGESDRLPGLIVDRYGDYLVCQFLFAGMELHKAVIVGHLARLTGCRGIYERSDVPSREKEGLRQTCGTLAGDPPPTGLLIREYDLQFEVDVLHGQKTGFYLDQADNRHFLQGLCNGKSVLNCFAYTGGFSLAALKGGADHVTSVDSAAAALEKAIGNVARNEFSAARHMTVEGNAFHLLREWHKTGNQYDVIVLDPPKFAENKAQLMKASRAYKDLALQAARLVRPDGLLVTFSCSGGLDPGLFQKITADALLDARRSGDILHFLHQAPDHPVALAFPESQYLKGLVCRLD